MTDPEASTGPDSDRHEFPVIGEPLPLELLNTAHSWEGEVEESLTNPTALRAWCGAAVGAIDLTVTAADLAAVLRLRGAVARVVAAARVGHDVDVEALEVVNEDLVLAPPARRLDRQGGRVVTVAGPAPTSVAQVRGAVAVATVELVSGAIADRLRECANPPCGMLFLAGHGRRRYCTTWCSNHDRQRRFRERHGRSVE